MNNLQDRLIALGVTMRSPIGLVIGFVLIDGVIGFVINTFVPNPIYATAIGLLTRLVTAALFIALYLVRRASMKDEIKLLNGHYEEIYHATNRSSRFVGEILTFLRPRLETHLRECRTLFQAGFMIKQSELGPLSKAAFRAFRGSYIGLDSNPPSRFRDIYPTFLEDQVATRTAADYRGNDIRVLLVSEADLKADALADPGETQTFVDFHKEHGIHLLQVDPAAAERERERLQLMSTDIAIYGTSYAIFFRTQDSSMVEIAVQPISPELGPTLRLYIERLNRLAHRVDYLDGNLTLHPRDEAEMAARLKAIQLEKFRPKAKKASPRTASVT